MMCITFEGVRNLVALFQVKGKTSLIQDLQDLWKSRLRDCDLLTRPYKGLLLLRESRVVLNVKQLVSKQHL